MHIEKFVRYIDHTLLKAEATPEQIDRLCDEAIGHGFHSVVVNPIYVKRAADRLEGQKPVVGSVAGFPLGAVDRESMVEQTRRLIEAGAVEVDMVAWIGGLVAGEKDRVVETIHAVSCAVHGGGGNARILKVILETPALTDEQTILGCRCCAEGEADFVKTATGFHPGGGATVKSVRLLHRHASPLGVKASGGIRTLESALAMIEAGATRLGTSSGLDIVSELRRTAATGERRVELSDR